MAEAVAKEKKPRTRRNFERILTNAQNYCEAQISALTMVKAHLTKSSIPTEAFDNQIAVYQDVLGRLEK